MVEGTIYESASTSLLRRRLLLLHFLLTCVIAAVLSPIFISVVGFNARDVDYFTSNRAVCQKLVEGSAQLVQQSQLWVDKLQASPQSSLADLAFAQKQLEWSKGIARKDREHLEWNERTLQSTMRFSQFFFYFSLLLGIGLLFSLFLSAHRFFRHVWRETVAINEPSIPR